MKYNFSSDVQERVDSFINNQTDDLSRNKIQKLILDGKVMINGIVNLSKKKKLNEGDVVEIDVNLTPSELKPISG
ncbi:MAG: hypothetical protein DRP42_01755 [Tenericutes bacterium]|nr:MAG: hypothetical protein DRP42_01755 [Mycoplasmatota bacterium]